MERVIVFMLDQTKTLLKPRFVSCRDAERIESRFIFPLASGLTVFNQVYEQHVPLWVDDPNAQQWRRKITPAIQGLSQGMSFFVGPLMVNKKCLGLIYADRAETEEELTSEDFAAFNHFTGQLSLCLSHRFQG